MLKTNGKNLNCAIGVLSKYFNSTLIRFFKSLRIKYCKKKKPFITVQKVKTSWPCNWSVFIFKRTKLMFCFNRVGDTYSFELRKKTRFNRHLKCRPRVPGPRKVRRPGRRVEKVPDKCSHVVFKVFTIETKKQSKPLLCKKKKKKQVKQQGKVRFSDSETKRFRKKIKTKKVNCNYRPRFFPAGLIFFCH